MNYKPGDLVLAKNIIFEDGHHDKTNKGRPCIVLYSKPKVINNQLEMCSYCLYMTDKKQYLLRPFHNKYTILDRSENISLVYLASVLVLKSNDLTPIYSNIGIEYLRIARNFVDYNFYNFNNGMLSVIDELEKMTGDINAFAKELKSRKHVYDVLRKEEKKLASPFEKVDKIAYLVERSKHLVYKRTKEKEYCSQLYI